MTDKTVEKRLCIIQITRFGDLIQTLQACEGLKENVPHLKLHLVARKKFAHPLRFILEKTFDHIHYLDFKNSFMESRDPDDLTRYLKGFVAEINSFKLDALLNLSFSHSANYLCSLIHARNKLGTYYNNNHEIVVHDPWSQYLYSNVLGGSFNTFSLVDIYKKIIGNTFKPVPRTNTGQNSNQMVIHPFASLSKKHWKPGKWKEIIYKLLKSNPSLSIQLVGSKEEMASSNEIFNDPIIKPFHGRLINLTGKTNLQELFEILRSSAHFVGHDSMVSHMAKLAGLPTLTIALGTVRPEETAPYGANTYVLSPKTTCFPCFPDEKCDFYQCHADISYQAAYEVICTFAGNRKLEPKKLEETVSSFHMSSISIFEGTFSKNNVFHLQRLGDSELNAKNTVKLFYRMAWLYKLSEIEEVHAFPSISKSTYNELFNLIKGMKHLKDLLIFGQKYSQEILEELQKDNPVIAQLHEKSERIDEIDKLTQMLKTAYPLLCPIIDYTNVTKANIPGDNLVELSYGSSMAYRNSETILTISYELLENTLRESKFGRGVPKEG